MAEQIVDFLAKKFPPQKMVIGRGILPVRGKLILGGPPKVGKSFVVANVALDLALGRPLFQASYSEGKPVFPVYRPNRVLLFDMEMGDIGLQDRLRPIFAGADLTHSGLFIKSRDMGLRMDTPEGRELLAQEITQVRPDVVIMDPLVQFHLSDENSSQHMSAIMRVGDHWIEDFGISIIYIHHTGHPDAKFPRRGGDRLRGSTAIFAAADTVILVDNHSSGNTLEPLVKLEFVLRRGRPMDPIYVRRMADGAVKYVGENLANPSSRETPASGVPYKGL